MKTRLISWMVCAALAACSGRSDEELLAAAAQRMQANDPGGASIELKNLLQRNPDNAQARQLLGKALLDAGDLAGAEIELRRAQDLGASPSQVAPLLAQALLESGQGRKLISELADRSLAEPEATAKLQGSLALAYLQQGNLLEAKAAATKAQQSAPGTEASVLVNARVRAAAGSRDEALNLLDELLARQAKSVKALQLKAEILAGMGRNEEVIDLLQRILQLDPNVYEARSLLLREALAKNRIDDATKLVESIPEKMAKRPQGRFLQAQLALAKGDAAKARELGQPLLKVMPNYVPLLRLLAGAHQQLGQIPDAENMLGQALKQLPEDRSLRRQYANLQLQARQPARALDTLKAVIDSGKVDADTLLIYGRAQMAQGNFAAADGAFAQAAKLRPEDPRLQAALALSTLVRDGGSNKAKADAAVAQLRELAAKDAGSAYDMLLVNAQLRRRDLPAALAAIDKLQAKTPNSPEPFNLRGRVQLAQKDFKQARASFEAASKADPKYLPAVLGLAALDQHDGRVEDAVKRLEAFVGQQSQSAMARLALAEMLFQSKADAERITTVLTEGVRLEPNEPALRVALIDHRLMLNDTAGAAQAAQEAAAALPTNPELLERLARTQLASNDKSQALKSYSKLTSLAPNKASGYLGLAQIRFMEQDIPGAEREIKRALDAEPNSVIAQRLSIQIAVRQGRLDQAQAQMRQRQKDRPNEGFAYIAEADIELRRQHPDLAIGLLKKAVATTDPQDAPVRLFSMLISMKKRDEALAFETQWLNAHPTDYAFAGGVADVLLAQGDFEAALSRYENFLKRNPDSLPFINNVAWLKAKTGKPGAAALAERGLKLKPSYAPLRDTYATVLAADKQYDKAINLQRQLISDVPDQPAYKITLAQVLIAAGKKDVARQELEALAKLGPQFSMQAQVAAMLKSL